MKAIIATFELGIGIGLDGPEATNHLWLAEGWIPASQLVDSKPTDVLDGVLLSGHGFISHVSDKRVVRTLCGKYRDTENHPATMGWLRRGSGRICKRCQAVAKRKGIGTGYHSILEVG
jgi:hypothetical protein